VILFDKTNARAHNWYATFLKSIGEMEKAEEHAKKALQLMPNHLLFLHNLALFLMEKKDKDSLLQAEDLLNKSIARAKPGFDYPKQVLQDVQNMLAAFHE
jgi:Flp pilus assembly protein TadD